ncbi:MAG: type III-B CRISPR module-associated protein Cmr5 [Acidobacteria bacterium]|nr:type III-B CRISPR module-associated protein Cmr5 [Acidobacteriota bacterium]
MQTRDQRYAEKIFGQVSAFKQQQPKRNKQREYGSMAHKLPVLIRTAGLAQALAFIAASGQKKPPHQQLLEDLAQAIAHLTGGRQTAAQLLEKSRTAALGDYMKLTRDALSALLWYKRFAQSVLNVEPGDEPAENDAAQP